MTYEDEEPPDDLPDEAEHAEAADPALEEPQPAPPTPPLPPVPPEKPAPACFPTLPPLPPLPPETCSISAIVRIRIIDLRLEFIAALRNHVLACNETVTLRGLRAAALFHTSSG